VRKIISAIFNSISIPTAISQDLSRLNSIEKGLGHKAATYVATGDGGTVLSTLQTIDAARTLGLTYWRTTDTADLARARYLAREANDPQIIARYGEVLAAALSGHNGDLSGSDRSPFVLRVVFTAAAIGVMEVPNRWPRKLIKPQDCKLSPEFCIEICRAQGGTATDLFDILFANDGKWGHDDDMRLLFELFDFRPLATAYKNDFLAAVGHMGAGGKSRSIDKMAEWGMLADTEVRDFVAKLAGDGAKSVRQKVVNALMILPEDQVISVAETKLAKGTAGVRAAMVDVLIGVGSAAAHDVLRTHLKAEKTGRIRGTIETVLVAETQVSDDGDVDEDGTSYLALDGSRVDIPALPALAIGQHTKLGTADRKALEAVIGKENKEIDKRNQARKARNRNLEPRFSLSLAKELVNWLNDASDIGKTHQDISTAPTRFFYNEALMQWAQAALEKMPPECGLQVSSRVPHALHSCFQQFESTAYHRWVIRYVNSENADYRVIDAMFARSGEHVFGSWNNRKTRKAETGDLLRVELSKDWDPCDVAGLNPKAVWPMLAENFGLFDEAFGLAPAGEPAPKKIHAINFLTLLPQTPQRYYAPLLEVATGTTKTGRAEARALLTGAAGLEERLIELLNDTRQDARAGAAEWLADLKITAATKAIKTRLKKEKSDVAKASMLSALNRLGGDLTPYVGPAALLEDAERILKRAKFDKLDWLMGDALPRLNYADGKSVPEEVIKSWIFVANKLKQPGGNALFDIYMDQLSPQSAVELSSWIFGTWINHDTYMPNDRPLYVDYVNSSAPFKGLLALAKHVPPSQSAGTVRTYLKKHGGRTSQSTALLDMLAANGDPMALQIVISAATRIKQKSVQAHANTLIQSVAEAKGWSLDELADRTIPTAGLNDDGGLDLTVGDTSKVYSARMDDDFKLIVMNPDGKQIKSLPAGDDDNTKASKKALSAAKRELKQITALQGERLYDALCAERRWSVEDWLRDFRDHPVMGRLAERVIWLGEDAEGKILSAFRPTAEKDYVDADDNSVDPNSYEMIRLAHGALLSGKDANAWDTHLEDYEVNLLFTQFGRPLLALGEGDEKQVRIEDRKGWTTDTFTFRGASNKLGYERGEALDGGYFNEYVKSFRSAGLCAVIEFSGNCLPEENVAAAQGHLEFATLRGDGRRGRAVELSKVPPVLLSECWNDYRDMVAKASYDPDWEKKMPWM